MMHLQKSSNLPVRGRVFGDARRRRLRRRDLSATPLPERAERAIWEGRAARRPKGPSTDRGWAAPSYQIINALNAAGCLDLIADAPFEKIGAADYSGSAPVFPKVVKLERGESPAVDRMLERLRAAKLSRGNVMRTEGQDAAAGYVEPMPVPHGPLGAIDTERKVKIHAPGVTVTVKQAPDAAKEQAKGPRNFAREKGEIWARMIEEHPDDPPGTVRIDPAASLALLRLEEQERKVVGDGPLSMPDFSLPPPVKATSKELEAERHRQEQARQAREAAQAAGAAGAAGAAEAGEAAPESLSPMVTPPATRAQRAPRWRLPAIGVGAAAAALLVWRLVASPQGPGQAAPATGGGDAESVKTNSAAATEQDPIKTNAMVQEGAAPGEAVPTNPAGKADADAGAAVKPEVKEPEEKREPVSPPAPRHDSSVAPEAAPGGAKAPMSSRSTAPTQKQNPAAPSGINPAAQKEPLKEQQAEPTAPPPVSLPAAGSDPKF